MRLSNWGYQWKFQCGRVKVIGIPGRRGEVQPKIEEKSWISREGWCKRISVGLTINQSISSTGTISFFNIYQERIASSVLTNYHQMSALSSFQEFPEAVAMPVDGREEYIESVGYRVFTITRRRRRRRRATYLLSRIIASSIWEPISSISPKSSFFDWITFDVSYIREYKKIKRFENNFLYPITLFWFAQLFNI